MNSTTFIPSLPISNSALIFFLVLTIILFAPIILERFHIPHIIGLIFAGMVIGPHGINLLAYDAGFEIFGNVGLLYLMFLVGLEMSISDFKKNKREGIAFGIYTFTIPLLTGLVTARYIFGLTWVASSLLSTIYASHTLISFPIVTRYGTAKTRAVSIAIAGTVVTVVAALITMAIIIGIAGGNSGILYWILFGVGVIVYGAAILYIYPRLTCWFLRKYNDSVSQFIFILALVFAAAYLAEAVGLVGLIGAFFSGIVLTRYIPKISPLMNRIEFVGNALFIPYFLIGGGMLINLHGFTSWHSIWIALVMSATAIMSKWAAAVVTQKSFNLSRSSRNIIFGLSGSKAAATLVVVLIGHDMSLFDDTILNGAILTILISCTVSALVTESAAKEIALKLLKNDATPTSSTKKSDKILISVSNPVTTDSISEIALLIKGDRTQLYALNVINDAKQDDPASDKISEAILTKASKIAVASDIHTETISRYDINVAGGIIHTVKEKGISDIIIGLHNKSNIADSFFGSKTEALLKGCNKTVFITRMLIPANTLSRIVVAIPEKAEYETGFSSWITRIANMSTQLGCRVIFYGHGDTLKHIKERLRIDALNIRAEYQIMDDWSDIVMLTGVVLEDDLFIIISARKASVSYNTDFDKLPAFLSHYFFSNNLMILYPEQFGEDGELTFSSDPLAINVKQNHAYIKHISKNITALLERAHLYTTTETKEKK